MLEVDHRPVDLHLRIPLVPVYGNLDRGERNNKRYVPSINSNHQEKKILMPFFPEHNHITMNQFID